MQILGPDVFKRERRGGGGVRLYWKDRIIIKPEMADFPVCLQFSLQIMAMIF